MWNPFHKHELEHNGIFEATLALANSIDSLRDIVAEIREDVDYLIDFLDD
jgi:hypothetical protein